MDRETGRSKGFGFVTYSTVEEASSAIQALDGQVMQIVLSIILFLIFHYLQQTAEWLHTHIEMLKLHR